MRVLDVEFHKWRYKLLLVEGEAQAKIVAKKLVDADFEVGGLDIETYPQKKYKGVEDAGLTPHLNRIRLVQIYDGKNVYVFDLHKVELETLEPLLRSKRWFAHNGVFEIKNLLHRGIAGLDIGCSQLLSQLVYNAENSGAALTEEEEAELEEKKERVTSYRRNGHRLSDVCGRNFGVMLDKDEQKSDWSGELTKSQYMYAALDAVVTYHLAKLLGKKVVEYGMKKHYSLIKKAQHVIAEMELNGMPVDWPAHHEMYEKWDEKRADGQRGCYGHFGKTNLNSSPQMQEWIKKYFATKPEILAAWPKNKPSKRNPTGTYSFNGKELTQFRNISCIKALLQYKEYQKLVSTYGESLAAKRNPVTGCLHTGFTIAETKTGRLSSRNPNLQNFPSEKEYRAVFACAEDEAMIVADFSQIELRVQAELSKDPAMLAIYKNDRDIYCEFATKYFRRKITKENEEERKFGKVVYLALGYGMGKAKFVKTSRGAGITLSDQKIEQGHGLYRSTHNVYIDWCDLTRSKATQLGYARTKLGKMRRIDPDRVYTTAPNHVVQGTAGELMLLALLRVKKLCGDRVRLRNCVHDELILTCRKEDAKEVAALVKEGMCWAMEALFPKAVSFDVTTPKICRNWGEK